MIKDQNLEENSKTYLIMLSMTIVKLQRIIPKLMVLWRGWFKHARRDFEIFASLGTKRIGTWQYLTAPWVIRSKHAFLFHYAPYFYFLGDIPIHPFPLLLKWTRLWTWTSQPLGLGSSQRRLFYLGGLCPWPWRTYPLHNIKTPYGMHT